MNKILNIKEIWRKIYRKDLEIKFHLHFKDNLNSLKLKVMMTNIKFFYCLIEQISFKKV